MVLTALAAGAALYYLQVYAYYDAVPATGSDDVMMTSINGGQPEGIVYDSFEAIDSDSSPLRYRACFSTPLSQAMLTETYLEYPNAEPLVGPGWFDCFDAGDIGAALETGEALAKLPEQGVTIYDWSAEDRATFREAAIGRWDEWAKKTPETQSLVDSHKGFIARIGLGNK